MSSASAIGWITGSVSGNKSRQRSPHEGTLKRVLAQHFRDSILMLLPESWEQMAIWQEKTS